MIFALYEHPNGVKTEAGTHVVYDIERNDAHFGVAQVRSSALVWELGARDEGAALAAEVELETDTEWLMRCDRVDFPPGGVAHLHTHPGPGIRRLLFGELTIEAGDSTHTYGPGEAWFERADYPVLATASTSDNTAFVRVLLLPREWAGQRTIRYVDPADEDRPKLQRAAILLEQPIEP